MATKYLRVTGNCTTAATWSDTDGGAAAGAAPTTGDDLRPSTGLSSGVTLTMDADISLRSFDFNGFAGGITINSAVDITITGNDAAVSPAVPFRLHSGTFTPAGNGNLVFSPTSGTQTIYSASKAMPTTVISPSSATVTLGDAWTLNALGTWRGLTHSSGTWTTNNFNVTADNVDASSGTKTMNLGSSTITVRSTGSQPWGVSSGTTFNAGTSTIVFDPSSAPTSPRDFNAPHTHYNVTFIGGATYSVAGAIALRGNGITISNNLTLTNMSSLSAWNDASPLTIGGTITQTGNSKTAPMRLHALPTGVFSAPKWSIVMNGTNTLTGLIIADVAMTGSGSLTANESINGGGNTGSNLTINAPVSGGASIVMG